MEHACTPPSLLHPPDLRGQVSGSDHDTWSISDSGLASHLVPECRAPLTPHSIGYAGAVVRCASCFLIDVRIFSKARISI